MITVPTTAREYGSLQPLLSWPDAGGHTACLAQEPAPGYWFGTVVSVPVPYRGFVSSKPLASRFAQLCTLADKPFA